MHGSCAIATSTVTASTVSPPTNLASHMESTRSVSRLRRMAAHFAGSGPAAQDGPPLHARAVAAVARTAEDPEQEGVVQPLLYPMSSHGQKSWGAPATWGSLPRLNGDGLPVVSLTTEQRYTFDTRGWVRPET